MKSTHDRGEPTEKGKKADPLHRIRRSLRDKLRQTEVMIEQYEETMDYATHCSLQGFFEGIGFALDEIETLMKEEAKPKIKNGKPGTRKRVE
jgi:hypothetical protein